jgi:hypothetical protein
MKPNLKNRNMELSKIKKSLKKAIEQKRDRGYFGGTVELDLHFPVTVELSFSVNENGLFYDCVIVRAWIQFADFEALINETYYAELAESVNEIKYR